MRRACSLLPGFFLAATAFAFAEPKTEALQARGSIQATRRVLVSSRIPGRVAELLVEEGASVKAGQVLARLHSDTARQALKTAEAKVSLAEVRLSAADGRPAADQALAR